MKSKLSMALLGMTCLLFIRLAIAQDQHHHSPDGTHDDHSMSGMEMPNDSSSSSPAGEQELNAATRLMTSHHMDMGPHMKMTELRKPQPGDQERAKLVVEQARRVMEKYQDYHAALNDGFKIFLPNVPQHQYHFTNYCMDSRPVSVSIRNTRRHCSMTKLLTDTSSQASCTRLPLKPV